MIQQIENLKIYHLKIEYNEEKDLLIYNRKLEEGSGPAIYGLIVAKSMNLGNEFISLARSVQMEINNINKIVLNNKQSNYNSDVMMDQCKICSEKSEVATFSWSKNLDKEESIHL